MQRIEIGFEVPQRAVGADKAHQVNGIERGRARGFGRGRRTLRSPRAGERAHQLAVFELELGIARPCGPAAQLRWREFAFVKGCEKLAPLGIDRFGAFQVLAVEAFDEFGVGA